MGKVSNPYRRRELMDCFTKEKRSENMSRIRSKGTQPEKKTIKWFEDKGYSLEINKKNLPGKPDIAISEQKLIIFVHGCFWHHHKNCKYATLPKTNKKYWIPKIKNNIKRDKSNARKLRKKGWHVIIVWECQIKEDIDKYLKKIEKKYLL